MSGLENLCERGREKDLVVQNKTTNPGRGKSANHTKPSIGASFFNKEL